MTTLTAHPAYAQVEDLLDSVGQRYRIFLLLRGAILFGALVIILCVPAAFLASFMGPGWMTRAIAAVTLITLAGALLYWIGRPLLFRPRQLAIARMIEQRVPGIHNGLTNLLLLARADDLAANPWMDELFREIAGGVISRRLADAVRFADLRRPALESWGIALPILIVGLLFSPQLAHGVAQIASPSEFVPMQGTIKLLEVLPGNTTVIKGRSLEISATATGPGEFPGHVIFEDEVEPRPMAASVGQAGQAGERRFTFVREHIDQNTRYRVNVGGTESPWFTVLAIRQISLEALSITVTPPTYTKAQGQNIRLTPAELLKQPIVFPQGSKVQLAFDLDVPVTSGMLQAGEMSPVSATMQMDGKRFLAEITLSVTTPVSMLLTDGAGQIIARLPEQPLMLQVTPDQAPGVEMKWPQFDLSAAPARELRIEARLRDDYGLWVARLLWSPSQDEPMQAAADRAFNDRPTTSEFSAALSIPESIAQHGKSIWVQVEATDNRDLLSLASDLGPQTTSSKRIEIRFRDPQQITREQTQRADKLRQQLTAMLAKQRKLNDDTPAPSQSKIEIQNSKIPSVHLGQQDLRTTMLHTAQTLEFAAEDRVIQKTLLVLAGGAAQEAIDYAKAILTETQPATQAKLTDELRTRQRRVIQTLENLLAMLNAQAQMSSATTQKRAGDLDSPAAEFQKLSDALKQFLKEEQRILDQTASLAKKPVDNFDEADKKLLEELKLSQEKLDAFMQQKVNDFSNMAEQDMANASMLRELLEVYTEVTMAKNALRDQMVEMAISHEEMGVELAKEISSNLEKWLLEKPDRLKWTQEDQLERTEAPMAELPTELEDMIGELMEEQEDLFEDIEDANANWHDSLDKGAGWDAMDGPIDNMSAKGVTGNTLPNNNEMGGRAGEGRSGKSQGEMVEETATGKGGRNTPTRLDPTAFQQGQIKDESTDPVGGATGGGKLSGQGGAGLEGPVAPNAKQELERLKQRQAELRNGAERLNLQYQLGSYDNFKMLEAVAVMRRLESDLNSNRYQNALRRKDILLDAMDNSRTLIGGEISVRHDTTPTGNRKLQQGINDAMKGSLPPAWENALKQYYLKLGQE